PGAGERIRPEVELAERQWTELVDQTDRPVVPGCNVNGTGDWAERAEGAGRAREKVRAAEPDQAGITQDAEAADSGNEPPVRPPNGAVEAGQRNLPGRRRAGRWPP